MKIGALKIARDIRSRRIIEYYWRDRWIMTSGPRYIVFPSRAFDGRGNLDTLRIELYYGVIWKSRLIIRFPWYRI